MRALGFAIAGLLLTSIPVSAQDAPALVLGLQQSGTVQWEIEAIRSLGLDEKHGLSIDVRPLADSRAGQIALQSGAVDVILSDFVWVSVQRASGAPFTMVPHSLTVGALMVPQGSSITAVEHLDGKTIGVAGGPADKSWVILQAYYNSQTGKTLSETASATFGAPPLINELLTGGAIDAGLNFWQWNARAKAAGMVEAITVADMLRALGLSETPPLLGWTFSDQMTATKTEAVMRFLDASFEAKATLLTDDAIWETLRKVMGADEDDDLFVQLRDDYRAGIVTTYGPAEIESAEMAFALLAKHGGSDIVGSQATMDSGTFWAGYSK